MKLINFKQPQFWLKVLIHGAYFHFKVSPIFEFSVLQFLVELKLVTPGFKKFSIGNNPKSLSYPLNPLGFEGAVGKSGVLNGWENYL